MVIFKKFDFFTATEVDWKQFHTFRKRVNQEQTPDEPLMSDNATEHSRKGVITTYHLINNHFAIYDDKKQIGFLNCISYSPKSSSYKGNEKIVWFDIRVLNNYRRKGVGTQALKLMLNLFENASKSIFLSECSLLEAKKFYLAIGASIGQVQYENKLIIKDVQNNMLENWIIEAESKNLDTDIKIFEGRIPDEYIEEFAISFTESGNDQPSGDLETGEEPVTVEQTRSDERVAEQAGFKYFTCMTIEKDNKVSAISQLKMFPGREKVLAQSLTGVPKRYRGRKLGKWVKAKMLLYIKKHYPESESIITGNADDNEAMLHINTSLGFKKHKELVVYKLIIENLKDYLNSKESILQELNS